jgi:threonine/homoserine/homoserine lactone efflux protein
LIQGIESLKALENFMEKYLPIFLETLSFFLVTFDLYTLNKTSQEQQKVFFETLLVAFTTPIWILLAAAIINYFIPFTTYSKLVDYLWLSFGVIMLPIFVFIMLVKKLSNQYKDERKPYFLAIGCVCFIVSKAISLRLLN